MSRIHDDQDAPVKRGRGTETPLAPVRCAYMTAANVRCRRDAGHDGGHDTTYMFESAHDHFVALAMLHAEVDRETAERWQVSAEAIDKALPEWTDADWERIAELAEAPRDGYDLRGGLLP